MRSQATCLAKSPARPSKPRLFACALIGAWCLLIAVAFACPPALADEAAWPSFRADANNNAVTAAATPASTTQTALRWSRQFGSGWSASPSPQIVVGDTLVTMAGTTIYKVDQQTGKTLATGTLAAAPSFAYTSPTYADGKIFVPLSDGIIQAFDADTLQSLWVYRDDLGGQCWVPPTYADGFVYGGFYTSDTGEAHFVCLDAADGDPAQATEAKQAAWTYTAKGGFYWTQAAVVGDAVVFGTNDGTSSDAGTGHIVSLNRKTGKVISKLDVAGDQHSAVVSSNGYVYFTTSAGCLYRASVDGSGKLSNLTGVNIGTRSTSTPVIYDGRAYVGTSEGFSSGALVAVDAQSMDVCYRVSLSGPLQSSPVLSTAYLQSTGELYLYCTLNGSPGGMQLIRVAPGATGASQATVQQIYDASGHAQYCICSPAVSADGTLFYKNDSGTVFALEATVDASISHVTQLIGGIGTVTKDSKASIAKARAAYDALSSAQQAQIPNYSTLTGAEKAYAALAASKGSSNSGKGGTANDSGAAKAKKSSGANGSAKGAQGAAGTRRFPGGAGTRASDGLSPQAMAGGGAAGAPAATVRARTSSGTPATTGAKAATSSKAAKEKAGSASGSSSSAKASDASRASDQQLPDGQAPFPWWWLAVAGVALAALIGLAVYRRRSSRTASGGDSR
ncbi:MAG: PQQ-binding-like beta-propeller repeat protein [Eggerthellaceae bacterium]|jgi:hypothetical protein